MRSGRRRARSPSPAARPSSRVELRELGARNSTTATAARSAARKGPACRPPRMRTCVRHVRRAPLPLGLLVPRRGLAARRARGRRGAARVRRARADRPQRPRRLDGVRPGRGLAGPPGHPRRGDRPRGRASPHASGGEHTGVAQPVPDHHARARGGPPSAPFAQERRLAGGVTRLAPQGGPAPGRHARVRPRARRGPRVPERLRAARGA